MKKVNISICICRIFATLAVVLLHICNTIINNSELFIVSVNQMFWLTLINSLTNCAVPLFFMMTGALLLNNDKIISFGYCLNKYVKKIIVVLFLFGVPFSCIEHIIKERKVSVNLFLKGIFDTYTGDTWSHLWYLYTLVGIYLILPFIKAVVDMCSKKTIISIVCILVMFNFIKPFTTLILGFSSGLSIPITGVAIVYIFIGRIVYENRYFFINKIKLLMYIEVVIILLQFIMVMILPNAIDYLGYNSIIILLFSSILFCLFVTYKKNERKGEVIWKVDRLCFGVYILHPIFINLLYKFIKITPLSLGKLYGVGIFVFWIVISFLSFVCSYLLSKNKFLRKYLN